MKLEQQVSSLELSKRLKELGVKQESYFSFVQWKDITQKIEIMDSDMIEIDRRDRPQWNILCSAFTVAELGEMLPRSYMSMKPDWLTTRKGEKYGCCDVVRYIKDGCGFDNGFLADTEADARAKMLVYLLENKLIEL